LRTRVRIASVTQPTAGYELAMDPAYQNKKIIDLTDEELRTLEFLGQNVAPGVRAMVEKVRADPVNLGTVTCFMVDCLNRRYSAQAPPQDAVGSPTSPTSPTFL